MFTANSPTADAINIHGGSFTASGTTYLGIVSGGSCTLNIDAATSAPTVSLQGLSLGYAGSGTVNMSAGTLSFAGGYIGGQTAGNGTGTFNVTGGSVSDTSQTNVANSNGAGTIAVSGGTFADTAILYVGLGTGTGTLTTSGTGAVTLSNLQLAWQNGAASIVNLNGGSLTLSAEGYAHSSSGGSATMNFNGGTLRLGASFAPPTQVSTVVKSGGAVIDTNGFNTTFAGALTQGVGSTGGLTKLNSGVLTLSASNTYTGATFISGGTLALSGAYANNISHSSAITVGSGATLSVSGLTSGLTLNGTGTQSTSQALAAGPGPWPVR